MVICTGILGSNHVLFMVVGHTQFLPDFIPQAIESRYSQAMASTAPW